MKRILRPGLNCRGIEPIKEAGLIIDGEIYYRSFYHAARQAQEYILISGWQFDSEVTLLRGEDAGREGGPYPFLKFLNGLCTANKRLKIYILAWDFSIIFMLEREWIQEWVFNWATNERLFFRFDNRHAIGGSQHQKFAVIDGSMAFIGGMDICAGRWDDRFHNAENPSRRNPDGRTYEPYHDVQLYFTGPLVKSLTGLFAKRWKDSTGSELELNPVESRILLPDDSKGMPVDARLAAFSLTQPQTINAEPGPVREIRRLHIDAVRAAERLVYLENQYFSSYAVFKALIERMEDKGKPGLEIIIILPDRPHGMVEEISLGIAQTRLLASLKVSAEKNGHRLGVYYPAASKDGENTPVYIHSKLLIVDDCFMTVGSANTTNRSMGLDNELNISFEAGSKHDYALISSLKRIRADLLWEHMGFENRFDYGRLYNGGGLVEYLERMTVAGSCRLRHHAFKTYFDDTGFSKILEYVPLDPEKAIIEENIFELISPDIGMLFTEGITFFKNWFLKRVG